MFPEVARHIDRYITVSSLLDLTTELGSSIPWSQNHCEEIFQEYNVKQNVDILHTAVMEARARKQLGEIGKDAWKEDLESRAATRARTIPLLEKEAAKLRAILEQVSLLMKCMFLPCSWRIIDGG